MTWNLKMSAGLRGLMLLGGVATLGAGATPACATPLRSSAGPYELQVLVGGAPVRTFYHSGETYVLGAEGERYTLRLWNRSSRRIEAVVTVDGRDVVDGKAGDYRNKRGYVVSPNGHIDIDGWRLSQGQVAAFRFSGVADSYAARTGSAREVGVVGVAVFPERYVPPVYIPRPRPYRYDDYYNRYDGDGRRGGDEYGAGPPAPARKSAEPQAEAAPPPASTPPSGGLAHGTAPRDYEARDKREESRGRPGLGTAFGESVNSRVYQTEFVRQSAGYPSVVLGLRYNDREGLIAMGVDVDGWRRPWNDQQVRRTAEPFPASDRSYATPPPGWEY